MQKTLHRHTISVRHALDGVKWVLNTQPNYRIHTLISLLVIAAVIFFRISELEWIIITILISFGLVVETLNTALEATTDAITREWRLEIKVAKDASAAAMLTFAIGATLIALIIFIPKLLALFQ